MQEILDILKEIKNLLLTNKTLLSADEAAAYMNIKKAYLYKLCSQRKIKHFKPPGGRKLSFEKKDLDLWLKAVPIETKIETDKKANTLANKLRNR